MEIIKAIDKDIIDALEAICTSVNTQEEIAIAKCKELEASLEHFNILI